MNIGWIKCSDLMPPMDYLSIYLFGVATGLAIARIIAWFHTGK